MSSLRVIMSPCSVCTALVALLGGANAGSAAVIPVKTSVAAVVPNLIIVGTNVISPASLAVQPVVQSQNTIPADQQNRGLGLGQQGTGTTLGQQGSTLTTPPALPPPAPALTPQTAQPAITPQTVSPAITPQAVAPSVTPPQGRGLGIGQQGSGTSIGQQGTTLIGPQGTAIPGQQGTTTVIPPVTGTDQLGNSVSGSTPGPVQGTGLRPSSALPQGTVIGPQGVTPSSGQSGTSPTGGALTVPRTQLNSATSRSLPATSAPARK